MAIKKSVKVSNVRRKDMLSKWRKIRVLSASPRISAVRTDAELKAAQAKLDSLLRRGRLSKPEKTYLERLTKLVGDYEDKTEPPPDLSPSEMLQLTLEVNRMTAVDLSAETGIAAADIEAIASGRLPMSQEHAGLIAKAFCVSPSAFMPATKGEFSPVLVG